MKVALADAADTEALGAQVAAAVTALPGGWLVMLEGGLGAGKTTLVRGFLRSLGYAGRVPSPTYTLVEPYEIAGRHILHVDLYRLADPGELEYLGLRDSLQDDTLALIEWPERAAGALGDPDLRIRLEMAGTGRAADLLSGTARGRSALTRLETSLRAADEETR